MIFDAIPDPILTTTSSGKLQWVFPDGIVLPFVGGGSDDGNDDAGGEGGQGGDGDGGNQEPPAPPAKVEFTPEQQAKVDDLIGKATGKAKSTAEADFKKWLEQQGMAESDRLKAERDQANADRDSARQEALVARVETTAERLALAAGCKPDRVSKLMRLLDLTSDTLTADGKPDSDAIKALVEKELADTPELKGSAAASGASGAEDMGGDGGGKKWTREEISKLSTEDFEKNEAEIMKQLQSSGVS